MARVFEHVTAQQGTRVQALAQKEMEINPSLHVPTLLARVNKSVQATFSGCHFASMKHPIV